MYRFLKETYWRSMPNAVLLILLSIGVCNAQTATTQTDSIAVTTSAQDSIYTTSWESAIVIFKGCDGLIKYAISRGDTSGWSSKQWLPISDGQSFSITKSPGRELGIPGLYRLEFKASSGSGAIVVTGTKKR